MEIWGLFKCHVLFNVVVFCGVMLCFDSPGHRMIMHDIILYIQVNPTANTSPRNEMCCQSHSAASGCIWHNTSQRGYSINWSTGRLSHGVTGSRKQFNLVGPRLWNMAASQFIQCEPEFAWSGVINFGVFQLIWRFSNLNACPNLSSSLTSHIPRNFFSHWLSPLCNPLLGCVCVYYVCVLCVCVA